MAPDLSFDDITAILTVRHGARPGTWNKCDWLTQRTNSVTEITMVFPCPEISDTESTMKTKRPQLFNSVQKVKNKGRNRKAFSPGVRSEPAQLSSGKDP